MAKKIKRVQKGASSERNPFFRRAKSRAARMDASQAVDLAMRAAAKAENKKGALTEVW